jgi:tetratricopeptide (TPR) repeat protein
MFSAILVCCALVGQDGPTALSGPAASSGSAAASQSDNLAAYESAKAKAGETADAHVQLALWCEAHGLSGERVKQLAQAVARDPSHALARGLMGLVAYRGNWGTPEVIGKQIKDDPAREELNAEYRARRFKTPYKPDDQLRLARWCEENGLKEEAIAHFGVVLRLDPSRESVWRHLGYEKVGNRWLTAQEIAAKKREASQQKQADKRWGRFFASLDDDFDSSAPAKQTRAERRMNLVTDPRAVPMIWKHFVRMSERRELAAVQMLGQIEGASPAMGLAAMAVFSPRPEVRERATDTLARYDPRDIVEPLIDVVQKPFAYQVRPIAGPGSDGELFVEGERFNVQRIYRDQSGAGALWGARVFATPVSFDPFRNPSPPVPAGGNALLAANIQQNAMRDMGMRFQMMTALQTSPRLQQRLQTDVQFVEGANARISNLNGRALAVLSDLTGQHLGEDPGKWKAWWADRLGYSYQPEEPREKPTYTSFITEPLPQARMPHHSCFGAGTLVRTLGGPKAIESIQVGDRLLSQDPSTGSMEFRSVVAVYHNKPSPTLRLSIGGEPIVVTGIHRFWKAGTGWTMARELKPGDRLRAVGGVVEVQSTEKSEVQPVFNLEVAENRDYFVGKQGMLVHDNSLVRPVAEPFDRGPDLAAIADASH